MNLIYRIGETIITQRIIKFLIDLLLKNKKKKWLYKEKIHLTFLSHWPNKSLNKSLKSKRILYRQMFIYTL